MKEKNTIISLFNIAVQVGIENDVRGKKEVKNYLKEIEEKYEKMEEKEKKYFDIDFLTNPYHDSKIYYEGKQKEIKKIIVWIDVEWPEILLVNEYNKKNPNSPIDVIMGHHPEGKALLDIYKLQKSVAPFVGYNTGIPINQAEKIEESRIWYIQKRFSPMNSNRALSFAKLLDIPYFGIHTPADNCCHMYFEELIRKNEKNLSKLWDIIDMLLEEIPEMQIAKNNGWWPQIWNGKRESRAGKIVVTGITWGTESSENIYEEYAKAGVGTILEMHLSDEHLKQAKKYNINVIMTDHMASDSLWVNLIVDKFEELWIEILDFSGFTRVTRV